MQTIINFLKSIVDGFLSVIDFAISFFQDLVGMISLIGGVVAEIPEYFGWLPEELLAMVITLFGIVVLYKILGRD